MNENLESQNSTLTPQVSAHKRRYLTLKREQLQAQTFTQSELLQVKEEDREKAVVALAMLARTIYRLREKKKSLKRAYVLSKKLRELEKDLRKSIAIASAYSNRSQKSNAENTLNQNLIRQNQHEYFIHKLQFAIALLEDKKERLEIQLLKFGIKLDRAEKY